MATTRNFAHVLRAKIAADPKLKEGIEHAHELAEMEQRIYDLDQLLLKVSCHLIAYETLTNGCKLHQEIKKKLGDPYLKELSDRK